MPREKPVEFSSPMARAIFEGRKTQARIPLYHPQPPHDGRWLPKEHSEQPGYWVGYSPEGKLRNDVQGDRDDECGFYSPFRIGDKLWVQEPFLVDRRDPSGQVIYDATPEWGKYRVGDGKARRSEFPSGSVVPFRLPTRHESRVAMLPKFWTLQSARSMPRWASRLTLRVTDVRIERLQSITLTEIKAEGIPEYPLDWYETATEYQQDEWRNRSSAENFAANWDDQYAKDGLGWFSNPWTWVFTFKVTKGLLPKTVDRFNLTC